MAVLAEVFGDDGARTTKKDTQGGEQNQGRPNQVCPIMKQAAQEAPFFSNVQLLPRLRRRRQGPSA